MEITKLKGKDVRETRQSLLEQQAHRCAICGEHCTDEQAVLDHDHTGGHVRGVLHRSCNAVEGKIVNAFRRYAIQNRVAFLSGLIAYHEKHSTNNTGLIHPTHRTAEEKIEATRKRARRKRLALKAAREHSHD